jgi:hypothetical protein
MMDNIDEVTDKRLQALKEIEKHKIRVARAYNKKVKLKSFQVGDLVWKTILPIGTKYHKFGKWSPGWEGLYTIVKVIAGNSSMLKTLQGEHLPRALNGRYLKKYYPSVWHDAWVVKVDAGLRDEKVTRERSKRHIGVVPQKKHSLSHPTGGLDIKRQKYESIPSLDRTKMSVEPPHRRFHT